MKVLVKNRQRLIKISPQKIQSDSGKVLLMLGLEEAELSILLVNDRRMKALNSVYRGKDKTTDVLSFPQQSGQVTSGLPNFQTSPLVLGDVVINLQAAKRQAQEQGLSLGKEVLLLLVHGILHLIGYDHEKSKYAALKMRKKEKELLKYILRKDSA